MVCACGERGRENRDCVRKGERQRQCEIIICTLFKSGYNLCKIYDSGKKRIQFASLSYINDCWFRDRQVDARQCMNQNSGDTFSKDNAASLN